MRLTLFRVIRLGLLGYRYYSLERSTTPLCGQYVRMHAYIHLQFIRTCMHAHIHAFNFHSVHVHVHNIYISIYMSIYTCTHTHTHTHICTYIHIHKGT